jgi:hypothetical protein
MQLTNFDRLSFLARTVGDTHTDHAMIRTTRIPGDIFCESILGLSGCINTTNPPSMDTGDLMLSLYFHFEFVIAIWVALAIVSIMPSTSIVALCGALRAGMQFLIKDVHQNVTFFVWDTAVQRLQNLKSVIDSIALGQIIDGRPLLLAVFFERVAYCSHYGYSYLSSLIGVGIFILYFVSFKNLGWNFNAELNTFAISVYVMAHPLKIYIIPLLIIYVCFKQMEYWKKWFLVLWLHCLIYQDISILGGIFFYLAVGASVLYNSMYVDNRCEHCDHINIETFRCKCCWRIMYRSVRTEPLIHSKFPMIFILAFLEDLASFFGAPVLGFELLRHYESDHFLDVCFIHTFPAMCGYKYRQTGNMFYFIMLICSSLYHTCYNVTVMYSFDKNMRVNFVNRIIYCYRLYRIYNRGMKHFNLMLAVHPGQQDWRPAMTGLQTKLASQLVLGNQFPILDIFGDQQALCRWLIKINSFILSTTIKQRINTFLDVVNECISNERRAHFISSVKWYLAETDFKRIFGVTSNLLFQSKQEQENGEITESLDYIKNADATADFIDCISDSALTANVCKLFSFMGAYIFVDKDGKIPKYLYSRMDKSILDMVRDGSHRLIPMIIRALTSLVNDAIKISKQGSLEGIFVNPMKELTQLKRDFDIAEAGLIMDQDRLVRSKDYMISNAELFAILKKMEDVLVFCRRHKISEKGIIEISNFVHDQNIKLNLSNGTYRDQPMGFHIYGDGGAGKTALSSFILKTVFKVMTSKQILKCDPRYADISTIQMTGATKRDDITTNAHMGIIIDEFCTTKPDTKTGGELFARVLKMFSGVREPIEKAHLDDKAKIYYNHKAGVIISNHNLMRYTSEFLAAPAAWYRRFISIRVERDYSTVLPNGLNPVKAYFETFLNDNGALNPNKEIIRSAGPYLTHTDEFQKELIRRIIIFYENIILPGIKSIEYVDDRLIEFDRLYNEVMVETQGAENEVETDMIYSHVMQSEAEEEVLEGVTIRKLDGIEKPPDNIFSVDGNYSIFDSRTWKRQEFLHFVDGVQYHYNIIPILILLQKNFSVYTYQAYCWLSIFYPYILCYFMPLGFYYIWIDGVHYCALFSTNISFIEYALRFLVARTLDVSNGEFIDFFKGKFLYYRILAMCDAADAIYKLTSGGCLDHSEYVRLSSRASSNSILLLLKPDIDATLLEHELMFKNLALVLGGMGIGGALYSVFYNYMFPNVQDEAIVKRSVESGVSREDLREYLTGINMEPIRIKPNEEKSTMWVDTDNIFPYASKNDTVLKMYENCIWELFKNGDPIGFGLAVHANMIAFPAHFAFSKKDVIEIAKYGKSVRREIKMTNVDIFVHSTKDLAFIKTDFPLKTCYRHLAHKDISEYSNLIKQVYFLGHSHRPGELLKTGVYAYASDIHGQGFCGIVASALVGGKYVPIGIHRGIRSDGPIRNAMFSQNQVVPISLLDVAKASLYFRTKDKHWHDFTEQVHKDDNIPIETNLHKHAILNYREFNDAEFVGTVPSLHTVSRGTSEGKPSPLIEYGHHLGLDMYENGKPKFVPADLTPKVIDGNYISPIDGYLTKINKTIDTPVDVGFIEACKGQFITYLLTKFKNNHDGSKLSALDLDYVLAGDNERRGINAINVRSSAGLTFRNKNADFISVNVDREVPGIPLPRDLDANVIACVKDYIQSAQNDESPMMFFKVNLKAEGRKYGKAPRVFYGGELLQTILDRMYFLPLLEFCKDASLYDFCAVGINAMSPEWGQMFDDMAAISPDTRIFGATDIAGFDTQMLDIIQKVGYDLNMCLAREVASPEFCKVLSALLTNRVNTPLVFNDVVMFLPKTMTSGTVGTCEWNSMILLFLLFVSYKKRYGLGADASDFFADVRPKIFGDDNTYSTKKKDFTPYVIQKELAKFGITVTSDTKGDCEDKLVSKEEVTFLNRRCIDRIINFRGNEVKISFAPIEESSTIKMLSVLMPSDSPDQISDILFQLALENVQYGEQSYNNVCAIISEIIIPDLERKGIMASFTKRPYDSWIERMYFTADKITDIDNDIEK